MRQTATRTGAYQSILGGPARLLFPAVLAALIAAPLHAADQPATASLSPQQRSQAMKRLAEFRRYRAVPKRQVEAVKQLAAIGPGAVELLKDFLDKDIVRLATQIEAGTSNAAGDKRIAELRAILAKLRGDPDLTKEKLQTDGLSALDQLTIVYRQRQTKLRAEMRKVGRAAEELRRLSTFFKELQTAWDDPAAVPLPVAAYQQEIDRLLAAVAGVDEVKLERAAEQNAPRTKGLDPGMVEGMRAVNGMRVMCGLEPLLVDPKLCAAATGHSNDMATRGFFDHTSPIAGKTTFNDRAKQAGTTASGENIYMGSVSPAAALKAWFLSPPHHKNVLSEQHRRQGLGRSGKYWTHMFGR